jgi:hypothetical protein
MKLITAIVGPDVTDDLVPAVTAAGAHGLDKITSCAPPSTTKVSLSGWRLTHHGCRDISPF